MYICHFTHTRLRAACFFIAVILLLGACAAPPVSIADGAQQNAGATAISPETLEELIDTVSAPDASSAVLATGIQTIPKVVCFAFEGMGDSITMQTILDKLEQLQATATFFLPGIRVAEEPDIAKDITARGHEIGNNTLFAKPLEGQDADQIITDIYRTNAIIHTQTGASVRYLRTADAEPSELVLKAAAACGLEAVVGSDANVHSDEKTVDELVSYFMRQVRRGSIMDFNIASANEKDITLLLKLLDTLSETGYHMVSVSDLLQYDSVDTSTDYLSLNTDLSLESEVFRYAYTIQEAVSLTFDRLGSDEMANGILDALDESNIKATFFLSGYNVADNPDMAKEILRRGHTIENATLSNADMSEADYNHAYTEIAEADKVLRETLDITPRFLRTRFSKGNDATLEAAQSLNYIVVKYSKNPQDTDMKSAKEIETYIKKSITRGEIIILNADTNPAVIEAIPLIAKAVRSIGYGFVPIEELYDNQYVRRPLSDIAGYNAAAVNLASQAGTPEREPVFTLPASAGKKVALTFDDWGSDRTVTRILHILKANSIKASFFLIGKGVENNPNLAMAIAADGHDICNHSYSHQIITTLNAQQLQDDIVKGHRAITYAIQRQPLLMFRPPTFEISDDSVKAVHASGYKNVIMSDV
ncbi:MAG: polysaccharide deacetylase family protein, partial [Acetanaerobacterium sp.]